MIVPSLKRLMTLLLAQIILGNTMITTVAAAPKQRNTPDMAAEYDQSIQLMEGRLPLSIERFDQNGLTVHLIGKTARAHPGTFYLTSIDGQTLSATTPRAIFNLLRGTAGQAARVGLLALDGKSQELALPYETLQKEPVQDQKLFMIPGNLAAFDGTGGITWEQQYNFVAQTYGYGHLDLLSVASGLECLDLNTVIAGTTDAYVDSAAIPVAAQLVLLGKLDKARPVLRTIEKLSAYDSDVKRRLDPRYPDLLNALNYFNMPEEAIKIGAPVIEADQKNYYIAKSDATFEIREVKFPMYLAYASSLNEVNHPSREAFTATLDPMSKMEQIADGNPTIMRANIYARAGNLDKARDLYAAEIAEWQRRAEEIPQGATQAAKLDLQTVIFMTDMLRGLAAIELKSGDRLKAILHLTQAKNLFQKQYASVQLAAVSQVPGLKTSPKTIDDLLKLAQADEGPNLVDLNIDLHDFRDRPQSERQFALHYKALESALEKNNTVEIAKSVQSLLIDYDSNDHVLRRTLPSIDQYCALMQAVRRLANSKYFDQSEQILSHLASTATGDESSPTLSFFLDVERAINTEMTGGRGWNHWQKVWQLCEPTNTSQLDLMRGLTCLMIAAHEPQRAKAMVEATQRLCDQKKSTTKYAAFTSVLLKLDQAQLECDAGHYAEAQKLFKTAMLGFDNLNIQAASKGLSLLNKKILYRTVLLATACHRSNSDDIAKDILSSTIQRIESKTSWLAVARRSEYPLVETGVADVYAYMAKLLMADKEYDLARAYIDKAIYYDGDNTPKWFYLVRAECAVAQNDYTTAYQNFSKYVDLYAAFEGQGIMSVQPGWKEIYCRKAIYYALAAKAAPAELAKLYSNLANVLDAPGQEKAKLAAMQDAYANMTGDTEERKTQAREIARVIEQIGNPDEDAAFAERSAQALKMREAAATIAEKNGQYDAISQLCELAQNEVSAKKYDSAIMHLQKAVNAIDKEHRGIFTARGTSGDFDRTLDLLAKAGKVGEVEDIWNTVLLKAESISGKRSFEETNVLAHIFAFYAKTDQVAKVTTTLNKIFEIDPRKQEFGIAQIVDSSARTLMAATAYELAKNPKRIQYAQTIAERLSEAQRQTYGNDDLRTGNALFLVAQIEFLRGDLSNAEKHAREALAIDYLYRAETNFRCGDSAATLLENILNKESKTDAVAKLQRELKVRQNTNPVITGTTEEEHNQSTYAWWHANNPYNVNCANAGIRLLEDAFKRKDWPTIEKLAPECVVCLAHNSQFNTDSCCPPPSPAYQKFFTFKAMITACNKLGHKDEAQTWLQRALGEMSYLPSADEYVFLGTIENECGNHDEALRYCRLAESATDDAMRSSVYGISQVKALYEALGATSDVERIAAQFKALAEERGRNDAQTSLNMQKELASNPHFHKLPPADDPILIAKLDNEDQTDEYNCIEPVDPKILASVETIDNKYLFNYAAFATEGLFLDAGATVRRSGGKNSYSYGGSYNTMGAQQPLHSAAANDFLFVYDGGQDRPLTMSPPIMAKGKLPPAIAAPADAKQLADRKELILGAGDYSVEKLSVGKIEIAKSGRVRIFLKDALPPSSGSAFECLEGATINMPGEKDKNSPSGLLEIWYDGIAPLKLGRNSRLNGLIYAPHAEIVLDRGVVFHGAMVGRKITARAGSKIMYDARYGHTLFN